METILAVLIGVLYSCGFYMILRRCPVKLILGLVLLSQSANLLVFTAGGLHRGDPPLIPESAERLSPPYADPLPQALILTAIVIGFAILAFALVLFHKTYKTIAADDLDKLTSTDQ